MMTIWALVLARDETRAQSISQESVGRILWRRPVSFAETGGAWVVEMVHIPWPIHHAVIFPIAVVRLIVDVSFVALTVSTAN